MSAPRRPLSPRIRWRRNRREALARHDQLARGDAVALPAKARRTTSRGWGEWVDGRLRLPGAAGGVADFVVDDPTQVALVTRRGEAPVTFESPFEVEVRPVRYKAEAFHGDGAEIITVTSARRVVEIALPPDVAELAARRLSQLD